MASGRSRFDGERQILVFPLRSPVGRKGGGDSFSFQQGRDIEDIPNMVGHASGHCWGKA